MVQTSVTPFLDYTCHLRAEIETALDRYTHFDDDCPPNLRDAIRHSLLAPCKRLRPLLVLIAAEACGCPRKAALPAACAVEMVHTYSLIHDDLPAMDDDDLRRGRPSCHARFGEATAILAGDALLARAFELIATEVEPPQVAARCCGEVAKAAGASGLVGGQVDDLESAFSRAELSQLERIHRRKTGAMFRVCCRLGALVGRAPDEQLERLETYGRNLGLAFQITDDLLDIRGDEAAVGKRTGKDNHRGKVTFPAVLGVAESTARAEQLIAAACAAVSAMEPAGAHLVSLARYVLERDR